MELRFFSVVTVCTRSAGQNLKILLPRFEDFNFSFSHQLDPVRSVWSEKIPPRLEEICIYMP